MPPPEVQLRLEESVEAVIADARRGRGNGPAMHCLEP